MTKITPEDVRAALPDHEMQKADGRRGFTKLELMARGMADLIEAQAEENERLRKRVEAAKSEGMNDAFRMVRKA